MATAGGGGDDDSDGAAAVAVAVTAADSDEVSQVRPTLHLATMWRLTFSFRMADGNIGIPFSVVELLASIENDDTLASAVSNAYAAVAGMGVDVAGVSGAKRPQKRLNPDFRYVHELTQAELIDLEGRIIFDDMGSKDMYYLMANTSTAKDRKTLCWTSKQRTQDTRRVHYQQIREAAKTDAVRQAEGRLQGFGCKTLVFDKYKTYVEAHAREWTLLC
ncbi:hypothetical protein H4S02_010863 [Coemansia sp. RSA 2611]|nr:hypothetical protein H4S02_010863 [Coemansia sp. RSA 2611]KAJ2413753.1 hypothetical protein GGI10_002849 [Coemansia sp. RSA 2530]